MIVDKKSYKKFNTSKEANNWGMQHYGEWLSELQSKKDKITDDYITYSVFIPEA